MVLLYHMRLHVAPSVMMMFTLRLHSLAFVTLTFTRFVKNGDPLLSQWFLVTRLPVLL